MIPEVYWINISKGMLVFFACAGIYLALAGIAAIMKAENCSCGDDK